MDRKKIIDQLIRHEGLRLKPYKCTAKKTTIGVGRNLEDCGITEDEAIYLLKNDIDKCLSDMGKLFGAKFYMLSDNKQHVLLDMRFNLGAGGFRKFKKMIAAIKNEDYGRAAIEMQDSKWFKEVGDRSKNLLKMWDEA